MGRVEYEAPTLLSWVASHTLLYPCLPIRTQLTHPFLTKVLWELKKNLFSVKLQKLDPFNALSGQ